MTPEWLAPALAVAILVPSTDVVLIDDLGAMLGALHDDVRVLDVHRVLARHRMA